MKMQVISSIIPTGIEADRRVQQAMHAALLDHKRTGDPIAVWQDGRVVWIPADEIDVPENDADKELL